MNSSKVRTIIGWILSSLLTVAFLAASLGKLTGAARSMFAHWDYPAWFATLIGILELAGAAGLMIPKAARFAIVALAVVMIGAAYTHLANHEGLQVLRPAIFLVVLLAVWWLRLRPAAGGSSPASSSTGATGND